ncbi:heme exporter protein CcmB [Deinococcus aquaticus]|uniref:heme exporter protein CcmB n=1 Tax=Deinococcus aquaticus TaxID=328692 RepID=UPI003F482EFC
MSRSEALRVVRAVAAKDLRVAGRTRDTLLATAFFAGLVLLVLGLALSGTARSDAQSAALAAGSIWTALALAAAVGAQRAFAQEQEAGALEQLLLYPGPHGALYLGKLLGVLGPLLLVAAFTVPAGLILFGAAETGRAVPWAGLFLTTVLGVLGFAAGTTFYGSVTVSLRAREALLPALAFPILVPAVIATVKATTLLLSGVWNAEVSTWLTFLAVFDVATIILATLLFPYAAEG